MSKNQKRIKKLVEFLWSESACPLTITLTPIKMLLAGSFIIESSRENITEFLSILFNSNNLQRDLQVLTDNIEKEEEGKEEVGY